MSQANLLQPRRAGYVRALRPSPNGSIPSQRPQTRNSTYWERLCGQLGEAWRRHQGRQIKRAIAQYDPEKHFQRGFHAVVGQATMRMVKGEIERNKLPYYADKGRPWLQGVEKMAPSPFVAVSSHQPQVAAPTAGLPPAAHGLPPSLREPSQEVEESGATEPATSPSSSKVADGVVFDLLAQTS